MAWADELIPADLTYDDGGIAKPIREHTFVKDTPDLRTFVKGAFDAHREVGARVPVRIERERAPDGTFRPKADAVEKWHKEHLPKLYENGILMKPPSDPKEYGITKPEKLMEGVNWSEERAGKFAALGVKHGVSKAAMADFLELHREAVSGTQTALKTDFDAAVLELKREFGDKYEPLQEDAKRLTKVMFKDEKDLQFLDESGIGNHPRFLAMIMRLAPYAQNDSSVVEAMRETTTVVGDDKEAAAADLRTKLADIYSNPNNPDHKGYMSGDTAVHKKIDDMYAQVYGREKREVGSVVVPNAG